MIKLVCFLLHHFIHFAYQANKPVVACICIRHQMIFNVMCVEIVISFKFGCISFAFFILHGGQTKDRMKVWLSGHSKTQITNTKFRIGQYNYSRTHSGLPHQVSLICSQNISKHLGERNEYAKIMEFERF